MVATNDLMTYISILLLAFISELKIRFRYLTGIIVNHIHAYYGLNMMCVCVVGIIRGIHLPLHRTHHLTRSWRHPTGSCEWHHLLHQTRVAQTHQPQGNF